MAIQFFKEVIKLQRIISIIIIHNSHGIPLYPVFFQELNALHDFYKGRASLTVLTVFVMKLLRAVNGDTYQPVILPEKLTPFIIQERTIGLDTIVYRTPACILALQLHHPLIETERTHQCFSAMPGKQNLRHGLRLNIFTNKLLQQFIAHHILGRVFIQICFLQVITIVAGQITYSPDRLRHYI